MDKYIEYPLDKTEIDFSRDYMQYGGKQLLEILEKEFPVERIKEEREDLRIDPFQLERLEIWLQNKCSIKPSISAKGRAIDSNLMMSFFYRGSGLLNILYCNIDLCPVIIDGEFGSRYSFIKYDVVRSKDVILAVSRIVPENWSSPDLEVGSFEDKYMTRYYCFDKDFNILDRFDRRCRELKNIYEVMERLTC